MKKSLIVGLALAALNPLLAFAAQDANYPAANFEPKVVYVDPDVAKQSAPAPAATRSSADDSKYPAANFQPKVVFADPDATTKKPAAVVEVVHDPKYPAAYFVPKVIYP